MNQVLVQKVVSSDEKPGAAERQVTEQEASVLCTPKKRLRSRLLLNRLIVSSIRQRQGKYNDERALYS